MAQTAFALPALPPLLAPEALHALLGAPNLILIDLRVGIESDPSLYEQGHVPGAILSAYSADGWRARRGAGAGMLPEPQALAALFARLGIKPDMAVVLIPYGTNASDFSAAARAYWTLKTAGHKAVSVLDGGTQGWHAAGYPLATGTVTPSPAPPYPVALNPAFRAPLAYVEQAVAQGDAVLLDARSQGYFIGLERSGDAARAGRLPGASLVDFATAFDLAQGRLKPRATLEALFAQAKGKPVISYCNTGHSAALNWFVLSEVLQWPDVRLYDGSMSEWSADPARAMASG